MLENILKKLYDKLENLGIWILSLLFRLLRIRMTPEREETLRQFIKFGVVGVSNTLISYVTYVICLAASVHYLVGSILGFIISVLNSFYWNSKYVFVQEEKDFLSIVRAFTKMVLSYSFTGLILNNILLVVLVEWICIPEIVAPLVVLLVTIPLNFVLNKLWAFRRKGN